jgi:hypothetical protein
MRDYLRALGLYAIYTTTDGRAHVAASPTGDVATIMWTTQRGARAMASRLNKGTFKTIDAAAAGLRIRTIEHADVLERAGEAVRKVNTALAYSKARGELRSFHRAFMEYRLQGAEHGLRTFSYARAYTRLRVALFVYAAKNEALPPFTQLIETALGSRSNGSGNSGGGKRKVRRRSEPSKQPAIITSKFS